MFQCLMLKFGNSSFITKSCPNCSSLSSMTSKFDTGNDLIANADILSFFCFCKDYQLFLISSFITQSRNYHI
jgi:hypothetical protein